MPVEGNIDPVEPIEPTRRRSSLHDTLGCNSPSPVRHVTGMAAYGLITRRWTLAFPGEPTTDLLADLLADAEATVWPSTAPAT